MAEPINLDEMLANSQVETPPIDLGGEPDEPNNEPSNDIDSDLGDQGQPTGEDNEGQNDDPNENTGIQDNASTEDTPATDTNNDSFVDDKSDKDENKESVTEYKFKDDFIKKAVEYYEMYGTLTPYLEATSSKYDDMSDVDLLRVQFDKENADLSEKTRQRLFERTLEKYNLDSYEEDDLEIGKDLLRRDAGKLRETLKAEQQQFIQTIQNTPSGEPQPSAEEIAAQQEKSRQIIESGVSQVVKDNFIKIEANGEGINYQIADKNKIIDYALDSTKFLTTFANKDGQVDWDKWTKVVAFAENPTLFISELIKHGKSSGRKAMEAELKNSALERPSKDLVEGQSSDNPLDNPLEFLKAMKVTK